MTRPDDLTVSEAVEATGASRRTLVRRLSERAFPGAYRGPAGAWRIPVADLIAAGFHLRAPEPAVAEELTELRARLAEAEARARVAEAVAEERRQALEDTRLALRALTAGTAPVAAPEQATAPPAPVPAPVDPPASERGLVGRFRRVIGL